MTIDQSNETSTADPTYTIKSRVVDMKQLEALKKNLPKGIDLRISSNNVITFRARFRKRGHPEITQTFPDLKLAKHWLIEQNRNAMMGIHLPHLKASKRTLAEAVDRYIEVVLPRKPGNATNTIRHLNWWKKQLGEFALSAIRPQMIAEKRDELSKGIVRGNQLRNPATVVRYLSHLSHLFTIACKEWEWVSENPVRKVSKPSVSAGRVRYLEKDEIKKLLDCTKQSKSKDNFIAEYALRDIHKPMGVAEYETKIVSTLPKKLEGQLPTIDEIEAELSAIPSPKAKRVKKKKEI